MTTYYDTNQLRANPSKTQVCAFHLGNRAAKRELNVVWNGTWLSNTTTPVYLGVHLDRTLCYKTHIEKTKMKVNARNNIIRKLVNSKWGCKASTLRPSCLALCYSAAEYACPVWASSTQTRKLNPPYTTTAESSRAASNQRTWTVYTYWPVSPLLTSGGLLPAVWNIHDKRQRPDTNCSITDQLLADWSRGRASCAQSRRSTRLRAAADYGSGKTAWQTCQPPSTWDWRWPSLCWLDLERTGSVGAHLTDCAHGWAVWKQWWGDGAQWQSGQRYAPASGRTLCEGHDRRRT